MQLTGFLEKLLEFISDFIYLYPLLMSFVWILGGAIFYWKLERKTDAPPPLPMYPFFSILIPCHNEEETIESTVENLLEQNYPSFEIIAIDDGSSDRTPEIIKNLANQHSIVRGVFLSENRGKATALNMGCIASKGKYVVTIDADAILDRNALRWIAWHFVNFSRVGAVTGNPRVANRTTLLAKIQIGEYSTIIGLIKRTQRVLGKVLTVSGVIAAFRMSALHHVGFWDDNMLTEDIDITWKLEKHFWDVRYEPNALCWVLVPETVKGLWKQRLRWARGGIEVLIKHANIWTNWRQRRLWPIYLEYVASVIWSYSFLSLTLLWLLQSLVKISLFPVKILPPVPKWTGSILGLACLIQFAASICIDRKYERGLLKYYFWVIWYPFCYWIINALTVVVGLPKTLLKKGNTKAVWESPDRGIS